jgi:hypothetical protein
MKRLKCCGGNEAVGMNRLHQGFDRFCRLYLQRGLHATVLLAFIEHIYIYLSYVGAYLFEPHHHLLVALQAMASAALLALPLTAVCATAGWLARHLPESLNRRGFSIFIVGWPTFFIGLGLLTVSSRNGQVFATAPIWHYALVLPPTAAIVLLVHDLKRKLAAQPKQRALLMVLFCFSLLYVVWYVGVQRKLFLNGRMGLSTSKARLRSLVFFGIPWITVMLCIISTRMRATWKRYRRKTLHFLSIGCVVACFLLNALLYVDNYPKLHGWLTLVALGWAWLAAETTNIPFSKMKIPLGRAGRALTGLLCGAAFLTFLFLGTRTVAGYVGGVHTVQQRTVLVGIHSKLPRLLRIARRYANRITGSRPKPGCNVEPPEKGLPATFAHPPAKGDYTPNALRGVVVFFLDMQRPHYFGLYNDSSSLTPNIDRFFADAFVFENCYSPGSATRVVFPALYTSTYASSRNQDRPQWRQKSCWHAYQAGHNLPTMFKRYGFRTQVLTHAWYHRHFFTSRTKAAFFGGFETIIAVPDRKKPIDAMFATWSDHPDLIPPQGRFLLVIHLMPHGRSALERIDAFVGRVCRDLRARGRWNDTLLLLTADHGVQKRQHGRTDYGLTLFNEEIKVPLLLRVPGLSGHRVTQNVSGLDHLPTLADLIGLPTRFAVEGRSYGPALQGRNLSLQRVLFTETRIPFRSVAAIWQHFKLIYWTAPDTLALFDLQKDPAERYNLIEHTNKNIRNVRNVLERKLFHFLAVRHAEPWP